MIKSCISVSFFLSVFFLGSSLLNPIRANYVPGDTIDVVHYDIHLESINTNTHEIEAYTDVLLRSKTSNNTSFRLELQALTVDSVSSVNLDVNSFSQTGLFLNILLNTPINPTDTVSLRVYYHGIPFHEAWGGYHFSGDYSFNLGIGFESIPHNLGKTWFPCVDDFTDRASYDVFVRLDADLTAVCGGILLEVIDNGDNTFTYHWSLPQSIPTYLASVATGNYVLTASTYPGIERDIPVGIYTLPGDTSNVAGSFAHLNQITEIFENHFGAYQWDRIGYVGTSIGAMEHATNIAYPHGSINGNLSSEYLLAHELSHMWFGDLVTCDKAEEMWLNEGWASFCGSFFKEILYSPDVYYEEINDLNANVLQYCHTPNADNAYFPLNNIPLEITYGMTAYDRGATVVQSLRAYLGDELFFQAVKDFLLAYEFNDASSYDLRDAISASSGVNMDGFFENWVFQAGTPHYSVDSFAVSDNGDIYEVAVYPRQKRKGSDFAGDDNIIELTFMGENWEQFTDTIIFNGAHGYALKEMSFEPLVVFVDLNARTCDATSDDYAVIREAGDYSFSNTYFGLNVEDIADSAFVMVTHNWVPPDSMSNPINGLKISDYRYWKIDGVLPETFNTTGSFVYKTAGYLDNTLLESSQDSVIIMYRPDPSSDWQFIDFIRFGGWSTGIIRVDNLQLGEYTLAAWDTEIVGVDKIKRDFNERIDIYPNPSAGNFNIKWNKIRATQCGIFDTSGRKIEMISGLENKKELNWNAENRKAGIYYVVLFNSKNKVLGKRKLIIK